MITDIFLGEQTTTSIGSALTMIAAGVGMVAFDSVLGVGDSFLGILRCGNAKEWGEFTVASLSPLVINRPTTPMGSTNGGASIALTGTSLLRSVQICGHLLPDPSGNIDAHGALLTNAKIDDRGIIGGDFLPCAGFDTSGSPSYSVFINPPWLGGFQWINLTQNTALYLNGTGSSEFPANTACRLTLCVNQDSTGGHTLTYPSEMIPSGGSQPAIASTANARTLIELITYDAGVSWVYLVHA